MSYKEELAKAMAALAEDERRAFVGYGMKAGRAMGTLKGIREEMIVETPTAENLMMGIAIGLSLKGRLPLVYFERMDFVLNALDAIVNHLAAMPIISKGEFMPAVIIRVTVGNKKKPLFTGYTHTQNFVSALRLMSEIPVLEIHKAEQIGPFYEYARAAQKTGLSTIIVEQKDDV